jgi:hypothetical protein
MVVDLMNFDIGDENIHTKNILFVHICVITKEEWEVIWSGGGNSAMVIWRMAMSCSCSNSTE